MGTEGVDKQQQKVREFMQLLPLTLEIAGLARAEPGHHFTDGQLEVRGQHPQCLQAGAAGHSGGRQVAGRRGGHVVLVLRTAMA